MWNTPLRAVQSSVNSVSSLRAASWIRRSGRGRPFVSAETLGHSIRTARMGSPGKTRKGRPKRFVIGALTRRASLVMFEEETHCRPRMPYWSRGSDPCSLPDTRPNADHAPLLLACIETHASRFGFPGIQPEYDLWPELVLWGFQMDLSWALRAPWMLSHTDDPSLQLDTGESILTGMGRSTGHTGAAPGSASS